MINLLEEYIPDSLPHDNCLETNRNLEMKVNRNRTFRPFYGNTVVFDLCDDTKAELEKLRKDLYRAAGWMLSSPLEKETFHMTLHDLENGPELNEDLAARMARAEKSAKAILNSWKDAKPLRMKTTWLFNMVNTSIVLGLAPADEESHEALTRMYLALEQATPLNRPLTPHITMAYFCPGIYFPYEVDRLRGALKQVELEITLRPEDLQFQNFRNMNHYTVEELTEVAAYGLSL